MQTSADFRSESSALLTVRQRDLAWAVPGACVVGLELLRDWRGDPPLDVAALFGFARSEAADVGARVAVLDTGVSSVPLLVRGTVTLFEPGPEDVLPLPLSMHSTAGLVSHVALLAGKPSLLVLSPARLARVRESS